MSLSNALSRRFNGLGLGLLAISGFFFLVVSLTNRADAHAPSVLADPASATLQAWGATQPEFGPGLMNVVSVSGSQQLCSLGSAICDMTVTNIGPTTIRISGSSIDHTIPPGHTFGDAGTSGIIQFEITDGTDARFIWKAVRE